MGETTTAGIEQLTTADCWTLMQSAQLGRLAVIHADGAPDVFPVNYQPHEGTLYIRTARDPKLMHIAHHPKVAFEVDGEADGSYWSVVVRGTAERVTSEDEIRDSGVQSLRSWSPSFKHFVMKVVAHTVAGRRFALGPGRLDPLSAFTGDATPASPEQAAHPHAGKPDEIPHRKPLPHEGGAPR